MGHNQKTATRAQGIINNRDRLRELAEATTNLAELCKTDNEKMTKAVDENRNSVIDLVTVVTDLKSQLAETNQDIAVLATSVGYLYRRTLPGRWEAFSEWLTRGWCFTIKQVRGEKTGIDVTIKPDDGTILIDGKEATNDE